MFDGDKMQSNARRLVLLFGLMAVAMATKTAVKVEEKDIGDVAGAALTAGSGLLNPGQLGLMALGTVIKAGTNFFQAMTQSQRETCQAIYLQLMAHASA